MSDEVKDDNEYIAVESTRFGTLEVTPESVFEFPSGMIGFPSARRFIMVEHKAPFSWIQSVDEASLAFVVIDGFEFGQQLDLKPPIGDPICDFKSTDEFAILLVVTVRPDPSQTTVNLKAPLFVNMRNKKGIQVIYDDPRYSLRYPLWKAKEEGGAGEEKGEPDKGKG